MHDPDPEWAGELLFDVGSQAKRAQLLALQKGWISRCAAAGFKAIEPDNLDAYERALGTYTVDDAHSYMQQFVAEAHAQGLAVAQKNAADWVKDLAADGKPRATSIGFDFAVIEECQLTGDCDQVIAHYGAPRVFEIEYVYDTDDNSSGVRVPANTRDHFTKACAARGNSVRIVLRNRDVRPSTERGYVFALCGDQPSTPRVANVAAQSTPVARSVPASPPTPAADAADMAPESSPEDSDEAGGEDEDGASAGESAEP